MSRPPSETANNITRTHKSSNHRMGVASQPNGPGSMDIIWTVSVHYLYLHLSRALVPFKR